MMQQENNMCKVLAGVEIANIHTFHRLPLDGKVSTTIRLLKMTEQPRRPSAQK